MKKIVSKLILLFIVYISSNNIYSQTNDTINLYYTTLDVNLPLIDISNKYFPMDLDSLVLVYKLHEKKTYKNNVYRITFMQDTIHSKNVFCIISLNPSSLLQRNKNLGFFNRDNTLFVFDLKNGVNPDNLFSSSGICDKIYYQRLDCKIGGRIIQDYEWSIIKESPTWVFVYKEQRLHLFTTQFAPIGNASD